jgi:hypothetical protein
MPKAECSSGATAKVGGRLSCYQLNVSPVCLQLIASRSPTRLSSPTGYFSAVSPSAGRIILRPGIFETSEIIKGEIAPMPVTPPGAVFGHIPATLR